MSLPLPSFDKKTWAAHAKKDAAFWAATWGGCGLIRPAPGTWGTLGAIPPALIIAALGGLPALIAGTLFITLAGYYAAGIFEKRAGKHDSSTIVIDEAAGIWLTFCIAGTSSYVLAPAFLLFRLFDILKPGPIGWADKKLPGALGVMVDDLLAGIFAGALIWGAEILVRTTSISTHVLPALPA